MTDVQHSHNKALCFTQIDLVPQRGKSRGCGIPRWVNMRLKMASAVEGCWYSRLKTVPGRDSRYSNDRRDEADILPMRGCYLFEEADVICLSCL